MSDLQDAVIENEGPGTYNRIRALHADDDAVLVPTKTGHRYWLKDGLLPTRCFGDVSFNRTQEEKERIERETMTVPIWPKSKMISPPYLGWEPDVAVYGAEDLEYLIIATDGRECRWHCRQALSRQCDG